MEPIKLPPEYIGKIQRAQKRLTALVSELDKCENCGMDVMKFREVLAEQLTILQRLDENFGTPLYQQMRSMPLSAGVSGVPPES